MGLISMLFIAFLYQSTYSFGIEGGASENFPFIEKCGSFILGKDHLKLKNPFILSIAFFTKSLAALIGVVIAVFIPFHIDENISFISFKKLVQFNVNIPINTSNIPVIIPKIVCNIGTINLKAPSNIGANRLLNPNHIFFKLFTIEVFYIKDALLLLLNLDLYIHIHVVEEKLLFQIKFLHKHILQT